MTLETVVTLAAFSIFAICLALYIIRATAASNFRHKIAIPHGFTEGAAHGPAYPLWVLSFGLLFVQVAAFAAFPTSDELSLNKRITVFIINLIIFFILRSKTSPLLAIWFGKTGIWVSHGINGLIKFENVIRCEILNEKKLNPDDPNALCVLALYTKGRKNRFRTEKYVCCISARELEPYIVKLPDEAPKDKHPILALALKITTAVLTAVTVFSSICFIFATGVLSPYSYTEDEAVRDTDLSTIAHVSDVWEDDGTIAVHHESTEIVKVYSQSEGTLLWTVSRSKTLFPKASDGINTAEGVLRYTVNGNSRYFKLSDGTELSAEDVANIKFAPKDLNDVTSFQYTSLYVRQTLSGQTYRYITNNPSHYILFVPSVSWGMLLASVVLLYILKLTYTLPTPKLKKTKQEPAEEQKQN